VTLYPPVVNERLRSPSNAGAIQDAVARGTSASFVCGSFVELSLEIDDSSLIGDVKFRTNGCGYMIAAADVLSEWLREKTLADLHGLAEAELMHVVFEKLCAFPADRVQCAEIAFQALRKAMAAYRERRVEEFQGEKALICTCFGVSEETIVTAISENSLSDVDQVVDLCRAGSGCGSCRMLIQELVDMRLG